MDRLYGKQEGNAKPPETSGDLVRGLRLSYCGPFPLCMYYVCENHTRTLYSAPCVHSSVYSALCTVLHRARARVCTVRAPARARARAHRARAHEPKAQHLYYVCEEKHSHGVETDLRETPK